MPVNGGCPSDTNTRDSLRSALCARLHNDSTSSSVACLYGDLASSLSPTYHPREHRHTSNSMISELLLPGPGPRNPKTPPIGSFHHGGRGYAGTAGQPRMQTSAFSTGTICVPTSHQACADTSSQGQPHYSHAPQCCQFFSNCAQLGYR